MIKRNKKVTPMPTPKVKLQLILNIDGFEEIIDSVDYSETVRDLLENPELNFTENDIFDYVMEVRDKM
jgi:hypothetical protein